MGELLGRGGELPPAAGLLMGVFVSMGLKGSMPASLCCSTAACLQALRSKLTSSLLRFVPQHTARCSGDAGTALWWR